MIWLTMNQNLVRKNVPKIVDKKVVKFEKPKKSKQIKEPKYTLDRGTDGNKIKDLNYYYEINSERYVTTDDAVLLLAGLASKSTLEKNRKFNKDDHAERGPQYWIKSPRKVVYKILWLMRYREGITEWIKEKPKLKQHYAVTALNIPEQALKRINKI